jgi:hypothetical protein
VLLKRTRASAARNPLKLIVRQRKRAKDIFRALSQQELAAWLKEMLQAFPPIAQDRRGASCSFE